MNICTGVGSNKSDGSAPMDKRQKQKIEKASWPFNYAVFWSFVAFFISLVAWFFTHHGFLKIQIPLSIGIIIVCKIYGKMADKIISGKNKSLLKRKVAPYIKNPQLIFDRMPTILDPSKRG
jgi:hypothetical protein